MTTPEESTFQNDRRHSSTSRNRFGWVRRLMQGQNRTNTSDHIDSHAQFSHHHQPNHSRQSGGHSETQRGTTRSSDTSRARRNSEPLIRDDPETSLTRSGDEAEDFSTTLRFEENDHIHRSSFQDSYGDQDHDGGYNDSDQNTNNSEDNISTIPLKSIISRQSTKNPSILSTDVNNDHLSLIASTAETSLAPSVHASNNNNYTVAPHHQQNNLNTPTVDEDGTDTGPSTSATSVTINTATSAGASQTPSNAVQEADNESIFTLASSSRRRRRRSIDTNCSTNAIPPASIMERLSVQPTAANSMYANSIRTGNFDRSSQLSHYDDQGSSVRSF